nr:phosphoribosylformylglycinamidine synthase [Clostridiales bacterium]
MVYRVYVEKRPGLTVEADALKNDLTSFLGLAGLTSVRILNRYDAEGLDADLFAYAKNTVFSEPQVDVTSDTLDVPAGASVFAVEYLPGQYDQRADSAAQCIQILSQGVRPTVLSAKVYILEGTLTPDDLAAVKKYVINPVEAREASLETRETLLQQYDVPADVAILDGFRAMEDGDLSAFIAKWGLAMDEGDLAFTRAYFREENRDPTLTEIRMIDTYWSDHCR